MGPQIPLIEQVQNLNKNKGNILFLKRDFYLKPIKIKTTIKFESQLNDYHNLRKAHKLKYEQIKSHGEKKLHTQNEVKSLEVQKL